MSSSVSMEKGRLVGHVDFPSVTERASEAPTDRTPPSLTEDGTTARFPSVTDVFKASEPTCHRQKLALSVLMQVSLPPGESRAARLFKEIH